MSEQTNIEWADSTFNPWLGCTKVSPACDHCYAERDTKRFGRVEWGAGKPRARTSAGNWKLPERWQKQAFWFRSCSHCGWRGDLPRGGACGVCPRCGWAVATTPSRRRVFCASLADWLDNEVPIEWLVDLLDLIRRTPNLDWLLLTKRIGNWRKRLREAAMSCKARALESGEAVDHLWMWISQWANGSNPPSNVWLGATVINQAEADRDVPKLLAVPARIRFLSIEPMLGPIDLRRSFFGHCPEHDFPGGFCLQRGHAGVQHLRWIIAGGESGPHARPSHPDWCRSLRDQCAAAGVPFLFKQWGEWAPISQVPEQAIDQSYRSNRKAAAHEDQAAIDDIYGRTCTVESTCIWLDGSTRPIVEPMAFLQGVGGMSCFRIGKKAAGRQLDGRTHDGFPAVAP